MAENKSKEELIENIKEEEAINEELVEDGSEEDKSEENLEENLSEKNEEKSENSKEDFSIDEKDLASWEPKTKLGADVKRGRIKDIDEILDAGKKILEPEIVDALLDLKSDLIFIGQAKGKFGGGKRRVWRQTQRKTREGNVPKFSTMAVVGDENGHIGIGSGKSSETLPARDKAIRKAKLNIFKISRTCSAFDCACSEKHTVPFKVTGKAGSVRVTLIPAPQGTGLVVANELKKVLKLAGIEDVYSKTFGRKRTTFNLVKACIDALHKTNIK